MEWTAGENSAYVQKLFEGEGEAGLVVRGSFCLHAFDGLLEDLLVAHVGLDQSPEAGNHRVGLLVELTRERHKSTRQKNEKKSTVQCSVRKQSGRSERTGVNPLLK